MSKNYMNYNIPKTSPDAATSKPAEQSGPAKVMNRANEIRQNTPKARAQEIISELEQYTKMRTLMKTSYRDLPDDLREEIGTRDPMDEAMDRMGEMDPDTLDALEETYGSADGGDAKFSIAELQALVQELKTDRSH